MKNQTELEFLRDLSPKEGLAAIALLKSLMNELEVDASSPADVALRERLELFILGYDLGATSK